jgi:hypothetical protein
MKIGIAMFPNIGVPEPGRLGRRIENRGLESVWFAEHSHMQVGVQLTEGGVPEDRHSNRLELTASGPADHDRRTLTRLRGRGAHRVLVWLPNTTPGAESVTATPSAFSTTAFSDIRNDVEDCLAESDKVCVRATITATHSGSFIGCRRRAG